LKRPYDIILAGIVILLADLAAAAKGDEQSTSPYATAADLFKYAMKLGEQALLKVEPPTRPAIQRFPWKTNIVTTVFWVGEQAGANNPVSNDRSSWDANWTGNYGGLDNPDSSTRRNCIPVAFIPARIPSIVRCRTTMSCTASLNRKRHLLSHGSNRPTRDRVNQCARIAGLLFERKITLATRNGKIVAHFARIISSTCSKMNGQSQI